MDIVEQITDPQNLPAIDQSIEEYLRGVDSNPDIELAIQQTSKTIKSLPVEHISNVYTDEELEVFRERVKLYIKNVWFMNAELKALYGVKFDYNQISVVIDRFLGLVNSKYRVPDFMNFRTGLTLFHSKEEAYVGALMCIPFSSTALSLADNVNDDTTVDRISKDFNICTMIGFGIHSFLHDEIRDEEE